jgi:hypothetical protein
MTALLEPPSKDVFAPDLDQCTDIFLAAIAQAAILFFLIMSPEPRTG